MISANLHWGARRRFCKYPLGCNCAIRHDCLNYMPAIGAFANHDVWQEDQYREKRTLRPSDTNQIRCWQRRDDQNHMLRAIVKRKWPAENFQLCADNISVDRLITQGHMDWVISLLHGNGHQPDPGDQNGNTLHSTCFQDGQPARFADSRQVRRYRAYRQPVEN